jgi:hypothetical protein
MTPRLRRLVLTAHVTMLGEHKPRGLIAYGRRRQPGSESTGAAPTWVKVSGFVVIGLILHCFSVHLGGHGPHGH